MTILLVALGAAVGAVLRYLAGHWFDDDRFPAGTLVVNVAGSFLLGAFSAMVLSGSLFALIGTGLCGGLTTYSAFALETVLLERNGRRAWAVANVVGSLVLATAGFSLGWWLGSQ